jgi:uncharacterized protein YjbJ (UPF0337 family)
MHACQPFTGSLSCAQVERAADDVKDNAKSLAGKAQDAMGNAVDAVKNTASDAKARMEVFCFIC